LTTTALVTGAVVAPRRSGAGDLPLVGPAGPLYAWPGDPVTRATVVLSFGSLPLLIPRGPANLTPADGAATLVIGATLLWATWTGARLRLPYVLGVGVLVFAGSIAGLAGELPMNGLVAIIQDVFLLCWAAALANIARTPDGVRLVVGAWSLTASLWAVGLVVAAWPALLANSEGAQRATYTFGDENGAGFFLVLSMFVVGAARRPRRPVLRAGALACLALATVATGSLGAISGGLAGLAVSTVLGVRSRRGAAMSLAVAAALPLAVASGVMVAERTEIVQAAHESNVGLLRNSVGRGYDSSSSRDVLARETYALWRRSDALGRGPVTTSATLRLEQAPYPKEAHNDWLAALVERGVLGMAGLLLLVAEIGLWASRTWDARRLPPDLAAALPAPHLLVGALGTALVFSLTHEVLHDRALWALLAVVAGVGLWGRTGHAPEKGGTGQ